jgi:uncharacterized protein YjiS (DUF1127 family)
LRFPHCCIAAILLVGDTVADQNFCVNIRRSNVITQLKNAIKRHATIRRTTAELSRLSDRELGDLGIARCDINRVARSAL